jgi:hypothetical protein
LFARGGRPAQDRVWPRSSFLILAHASWHVEVGEIKVER